MHIMSISVTLFPLLMYNFAIEWRSNENIFLLLSTSASAILDSTGIAKC